MWFGGFFNLNHPLCVGNLPNPNQAIIIKITEANQPTSDWFEFVGLDFFVRPIRPFISNIKIDFFFWSINILKTKLKCTKLN